MFKVCPLQTVYKGEPYVGSRSEELTVKNKRIQDLEKEVKQLEAQVFYLETKAGIRGGYSGPNRGGPTRLRH